MNIRSFLALAALPLFLRRAIQAHIGNRTYPLFELTDADLEGIDRRDGSVADWGSLLSSPSHADPTVGEGAQCDPDDLGHRIQLAWPQITGRLYLEKTFSCAIPRWTT